MNGHVVDADKKFKVPSVDDGFDMMKCPHDPKAPVNQAIDCGCLTTPFMKGSQVITPVTKPFTERQLDDAGCVKGCA